MLLFTLFCFNSLIREVNAKCGLRPSYESFLDMGKRITGGGYAKDGEFPWHVSIQSKRRHICGGTMISALWILTAAHCFAGEMPPDLTVVVGSVDLYFPLEEHKLDRVILHEDFDSMSMQNDVALILLSSPIEFSKEKIPICLPFIDDIDTWQECWSTGWGTTREGEIVVPGSHVLQKVRMKLISREQCLKRTPVLEENMLCAEVERREKSICQVDSGGPLVCSYWNTMKWFQVGIISWGEDCSEKANQEILMSVYSYRGWIEAQTARRGKPFFIEGMDKHAKVRVVPSRAESQSFFLVSSLLLVVSLMTFRVL
ncbi:serine protease 55 [Calypte anna]|uniref:serine protease 55 n=1 Tax=Calypte anna TaxID=9244 RepID=UPI0011C443CD|nr:serine protease 55 [Calypte anna]